MDSMIKASDVIITMLPSNKISEEVYTKNIFPNAKKNAIAIECSTVSHTLVQDLHEKGKQHGIRMIDAPVTGAIVAAIAGTLNFMVGSHDEATFNEVKPILSKMGKNVIWCGKPGSGEIVKICNNLALVITMTGCSEAISLGTKLGVDGKVLIDAMKLGSSRCWSLDTYPPFPGALPNVPASNDYKPGFHTKLMLKDLTIATTSAEKSGTRLEVGEHVRKIYEDMVKKGYEMKDFSYVFQYVDKKL